MPRRAPRPRPQAEIAAATKPFAAREAEFLGLTLTADRRPRPAPILLSVGSAAQVLFGLPADTDKSEQII